MDRASFLRGMGMAAAAPLTAAKVIVEPPFVMPDSLHIFEVPPENPETGLHDKSGVSAFNGGSLYIGDPGSLFMYWKSSGECKNCRRAVYNIPSAKAMEVISRIGKTPDAPYREILAGLPGAKFADEMKPIETV